MIIISNIKVAAADHPLLSQTASVRLRSPSKPPSEAAWRAWRSPRPPRPWTWLSTRLWRWRECSLCPVLLPEPLIGRSITLMKIRITEHSQHTSIPSAAGASTTNSVNSVFKHAAAPGAQYWSHQVTSMDYFIPLSSSERVWKSIFCVSCLHLSSMNLLQWNENEKQKLGHCDA